MDFTRRNTWLKTFLGLVTAAVLIVGGVGIAAAATPTYATDMATEASWIVNSAQANCPTSSADGAIAQSVLPSAPPSTIDPYRGNIDSYTANYAAIGLLAAGPTYYGNVTRWVKWYMNHLNWPDATGQYATVYYYDVSYDPNTHSCTETAIQNYDAQDAWAATYLTLLAAWAKVDPADATPFIQTWAYQIDAIANAAVALLQPSGLTGAKSTDTAQYLMDNSEVVQGLNAYAWLADNILGDQTLASYWSSRAADINAAIGSQLWGQCGPGFYCNAYGDGPGSWIACLPAQSGNTNYEHFWDSGLTGMAQAWPTLAHVSPPNSSANSSAIFASLSAYCPSWVNGTLPTPSSAPEYPQGSDSGIGLAAALAGSTADAQLWYAAAKSVWTTNHTWPWTVQSSGDFIRTANLLSGGTDPVP